jgi:hypothetical protein
MAETYLGPDGKRYAPDVGRTEQGLQLVMGGVKPQTMKDMLTAQPMQPQKRQTCDIGLFDEESRRQLELFSAATVNVLRKKARRGRADSATGAKVRRSQRQQMRRR